MPDGQISVYVADDHPVYREGLALFLRARPDLRVVGEAENGRLALAAIRALRPDVAILDVGMPEIDGRDVLRELRDADVPTRVVLLSATLEEGDEAAALREGAAAVLSKEATRQKIADAVVAAVPGRRGGQDGDGNGGPSATARPGLSPREIEVLHLTAAGLSAPAIARELHLSPETVKSHLKNLYEKLGVSDRAHAVAEGMRRGLLE